MTGWKSCDSVPKLVEEYLAGKLKVDEFITHTMPLDKINEAFDLMHAGKRFDHRKKLEGVFNMISLHYGAMYTSNTEREF